MIIVVGADHAGFAAKDVILRELRDGRHETIDVGTTDERPVDFPDITKKLCAEILEHRADRGVLVCGTGIGACMAANKIRGIRGALAHDIYSAHQCVEHDDANVLCLGAQVVGPKLIPELVRAFLNARWTGSEDLRRRLDKLARLELQLP
jgi:ribose 5-phosphate isomerase B